MEGACGKILDTEDPRVVLKKIHRRNRAQQRTCSLNATAQAAMQERMRSICAAAGLTMLFVPRAWLIGEAYSYKMERIDVSRPLLLTEVSSHPVLKDLQVFFRVAQQHGIFPADFELYEQADGSVAMVDFDKFATWKDGTIVFPWGAQTTDTMMRQEFPFLFL